MTSAPCIAGTPWTIFPNVQRFPTTELAVRRAFHHAINKDAINKIVFHGLSKPATSFFHTSMLGYAPTVKEAFPYDPARAKKLLGKERLDELGSELEGRKVEATKELSSSKSSPRDRRNHRSGLEIRG